MSSLQAAWSFCICFTRTLEKQSYLRYVVPPSLGDTVIYDTWCLPASKAPLSTTCGASWLYCAKGLRRLVRFLFVGGHFIQCATVYIPYIYIYIFVIYPSIHGVDE